MWTEKQIRQHRKAAKILDSILENSFSYIQKHSPCTEYEVQEYIVSLFKEHKLKTAVADPIVAFGPSTSDFHYAAPAKGSRHLKKNTLIMIDIWAGLNVQKAPFADITWMAFYGKKVPKDFQKAFDTVIKARDASISLLRSLLRNRQLPTGKEVDAAAMKILTDAGHKIKREIQHTTGHSLGTTSPHGRYSSISHKGRQTMKRNLGYTIEPGLYFNDRFGIRSELNCYITSNYKLKVTTKVQRELRML